MELRNIKTTLMVFFNSKILAAQHMRPMENAHLNYCSQLFPNNGLNHVHNNGLSHVHNNGLNHVQHSGNANFSNNPPLFYGNQGAIAQTSGFPENIPVFVNGQPTNLPYSPMIAQNGNGVAFGANPVPMQQNLNPVPMQQNLNPVPMQQNIHMVYFNPSQMSPLINNTQMVQQPLSNSYVIPNNSYAVPPPTIIHATQPPLNSNYVFPPQFDPTQMPPQYIPSQEQPCGNRLTPPYTNEPYYSNNLTPSYGNNLAPSYSNNLTPAYSNSTYSCPSEPEQQNINGIAQCSINGTTYYSTDANNDYQIMDLDSYYEKIEMNETMVSTESEHKDTESKDDVKWNDNFELVMKGHKTMKYLEVVNEIRNTIYKIKNKEHVEEDKLCIMRRLISAVILHKSLKFLLFSLRLGNEELATLKTEYNKGDVPYNKLLEFNVSIDMILSNWDSVNTNALEYFDDLDKDEKYVFLCKVSTEMNLKRTTKFSEYLIRTAAILRAEKNTSQITKLFVYSRIIIMMPNMDTTNHVPMAARLVSDLLDSYSDIKNVFMIYILKNLNYFNIKNIKTLELEMVNCIFMNNERPFNSDRTQRISRLYTEITQSVDKLKSIFEKLARLYEGSNENSNENQKSKFEGMVKILLKAYHDSLIKINGLAKSLNFIKIFNQYKCLNHLLKNIESFISENIKGLDYKSSIRKIEPCNALEHVSIVPYILKHIKTPTLDDFQDEYERGIKIMSGNIARLAFAFEMINYRRVTLETHNHIFMSWIKNKNPAFLYEYFRAVLLYLIIKLEKKSYDNLGGYIQIYKNIFESLNIKNISYADFYNGFFTKNTFYGLHMYLCELAEGKPGFDFDEMEYPKAKDSDEHEKITMGIVMNLDDAKGTWIEKYIEISLIKTIEAVSRPDLTNFPHTHASTYKNCYIRHLIRRLVRNKVSCGLIFRKYLRRNDDYVKLLLRNQLAQMYYTMYMSNTNGWSSHSWVSREGRQHVQSAILGILDNFSEKMLPNIAALKRKWEYKMFFLRFLGSFSQVNFLNADKMYNEKVNSVLNSCIIKMVNAYVVRNGRVANGSEYVRAFEELFSTEEVNNREKLIYLLNISYHFIY